MFKPEAKATTAKAGSLEVTEQVQRNMAAPDGGFSLLGDLSISLVAGTSAGSISGGSTSQLPEALQAMEGPTIELPAVPTRNANADNTEKNAVLLVEKLQPHKENAAVYGDTECIDDLADNILQRGILQPLVVARNGTIISGHRRFRAAVKVGLTKVPVAYFESTDEVEILRALLDYNLSRIKSKSQIAAECKLSLRIKQLEAKRRQATKTPAGGQQLENFPRAAKGAARDMAGKEMGLSGRTAEKAAKIATAIQKLKDKGKAAEATELENEVNKSYDAGYKLAVAKGYIDQRKRPPKETVTTDHADSMSEMTGAVPESPEVGIVTVHASLEIEDDIPPAKNTLGNHDKPDSDTALEKADEVLTFLRSADASTLTAEQKRNWERVFDDLDIQRRKFGFESNN